MLKVIAVFPGTSLQYSQGIRYYVVFTRIFIITISLFARRFNIRHNRHSLCIRFTQPPPLNTLINPFEVSNCCAVALLTPDAQQVIIGLFLSVSVARFLLSWLIGMLIAPGMCHVSNSAFVRTSNIVAPFRINCVKSITGFAPKRFFILSNIF